MTNNMVLGLDIGVTSVGYGVISADKMEVIEAGVRLFDERKVDDNAKRRASRGARRLKNRRHTRRRDLENLFEEIGLNPSDMKPFNNVLELRVKGLTHELQLDELFAVCLNLSKHRGSSFEMVDSPESDDEDSTNSLSINRAALRKNNLFVCEVQLERLRETGLYRGLQNHFRSEDYLKELEQILSNTKLSDEQKNQIKHIIFRKRHYSEGPGSLKSPSEYGRFVYRDGEIVEISLIEKMLGKCSVYPDEVRAPHKSYSAEIFNFLNDLNNLSINGEKLTQDEKDDILSVIDEKFSITPLQLARLLKVNIESITGFRIDKNEKLLLTRLEGTKAISEIFIAHNQESLLNHDVIDDIATILIRDKTVEERTSKINILLGTNDKDLLNDLASLIGFSKTHALSLKALKVMIPELRTSTKNQMQLLGDKRLFPKQDKSHKKSKKISFDPEQVILSSVALRARNETFKVINALRKKYGEFDRIIIETTRADNSYDERKRIQKTQAYFETQNKIVNQLLEDRGYTTNINLHTRNKIRLYMEQNGKCIYTNTPLDLKLLIEDQTAYEIDHIIPLSISLDDSMSNKVLCLHSANQAKGNLTPLDAIRSNKFSGQTESKFKSIVSTIYNTRNLRQKQKYLLWDKDITKYSNLKEFINRNLVDTSYAARVVLNTLQEYFKINEIDTKVHTIKGGATSAFRRRVRIKKDRNEYKHHAIDALIIASLSHQRNIFNMMNAYQIVSGEITMRDTGEVITIESENEYLNDKYVNFISDLLKLEDETLQHKGGIKFSHKVDRKPNRRISDETIYSTREVNDEVRVVKKYKDIYDSRFYHLANDIINDNYQEKYLMAKHDPQTFDKIIEIVNHSFETFKDTKDISVDKNGKVSFKFNPIARHREETGEVITKYAKKNNGPVVNQLKYLEDRLGNHIDISHKYPDTNNKKVVMLQISPYRTDFYVNENNEYKFVTIRYSNVRYHKYIKKYVIDPHWYENQKKNKNIDESFKFIFSLHRGDILEITRDVRNVGVVTELFKFIATNNDLQNKIEVKPINYYESRQLMPTIGRTTINLKKYSADVLGNMHEIKNEVLKLKF